MGPFGLGEIVVLLIVALLVFGPDRLPEMVKQMASWVRDLRKMVANARRDINVSAEDLGINEEDLKTLRALRNPKSFVRDQVLDGVDLDDLSLEDDAPSTNGKGTAAKGRDTAARGANDKTEDVSFDPDAT